ncbi:phage tail protein [Methylobacterium sp. C25]|uniref:phage tail protein n=1 Tax=Methylobacterium sp. C25 TaxID=2721622 RepID=UPI001F36ED2C|nr:phage tail protein [Methylobacterium sp. C25]MCE4223634.1 phage tail protein [Methylobacterium sp. C25]
MVDSLAEGHMMRWGAYTFKLTTAAYQKLRRQDTWRWATQERFANDPAEQFIGRGSKTMLLEGVIFTAYNPGQGVSVALTTAVGTHQLDLLRYYADLGEPQQMVDGRGNVLGPWVLVGMSEESEYFLVNGAPQKQCFGLEFRYYAPDSDGGYVQYAKASAASVPLPSLSSNIASQLQASGLPADIAQSLGNLSQTFQGVNSNVISTDTVSNLATTIGVTFGFAEGGYQVALSVLQRLTNAGAPDITSIVNTGLPGAASAFAHIGITDQAAGNNVLALAQSAPGNLDRGTFMTNAATQIVEASGRLGDIGSELSLGTIDQNDRVAEILGTLAGSKASNPETFAAAFPVETYGELNVMTDNASSFASNISAVTEASRR